MKQRVSKRKHGKLKNENGAGACVRYHDFFELFICSVFHYWIGALHHPW